MDPRSSPVWVPGPGLVVTDLGGELIVLDPERGEMFSLNDTGRTVWHAIEEGVDPGSALTEHFLVDEEIARAEADRLIGALAEAGLVRLQHP